MLASNLWEVNPREGMNGKGEGGGGRHDLNT